MPLRQIMVGLKQSAFSSVLKSFLLQGVCGSLKGREVEENYIFPCLVQEP